MKKAFKKLAVHDQTLKQGSAEELSKTVVVQLLVAQQKKLPTKKSELVKDMSNQERLYYDQAISIVENELRDVFGMKLVGLRQVNNVWTDCPCKEASQFIIVSQFVNSVKDSSGSPFVTNNAVKGSAIGLILNTLYMLNREVKEERIWNSLQNLGLTKAVNDRQDNLRQFLKTELVDTMYVTRSVVKTNGDRGFQYALGIRAHLECDKYAMLQHISLVLKKPMQSFTKLYAELLADEAYRSRIVQASEIEDSSDERGDEGQGQEGEMTDLQKDAVGEAGDPEDSEDKNVRPVRRSTK